MRLRRGRLWWTTAAACLMASPLLAVQPVVTPPATWTPRTDYACDGGGLVPVWYEGPVAVLVIDGRVERLVRRGSGSSRYSGERREWTLNGDEATLSAPGQSRRIAERCQVAPLASWRPFHGSRRFVCADGLNVEVTPTLEGATLAFRGETYQMREVPLPSGSLFTDGQRSWRGPDAARMFAEADGDAIFARGCQPGVVDQTAELAGTIVHNARRALPAEAVVEVRLVDASRADAPAVPLARRVLLTRGEQAAVPFTLTYAPAALEAGHRYRLEVAVAVNGRARFRTTTDHAVLEGGDATAPVVVTVTPVR